MASLSQQSARRLASCVAPIAGGIALGWPFYAGTHRWLLAVALIPWGIAVRQRVAVREAFLGTFLGGLLFHWLGADCLRTIDSSDFSNPHVVTWLVTGFFGATIWVIALWFGRLYCLRTRWPMVAALPVVWILQESLRQLAPTICFGVTFPWLRLGSAWAGFPAFVQLADLGGIAGLSGLIAAVNGLWIDLASRIRFAGQPFRWNFVSLTYLASILALVAALGGYSHWRLGQPTEPLTAAAVLMPVSLEPTLGRLEQLATTGLPSADLYLWPECAWSGWITEQDQFQNSAISQNFVQCAERFSATLFIGCDRIEDGKKFRSTAVVTPFENRLQFYDKRSLVPWSEYQPRLNLSYWVGASAGYSAGTHARVWEVPLAGGNSIRVGTLICYDACFAEHFAASAKLDPVAGLPDLFLVSSSESAARSRSLPRQMLWLVQCRAVECRRPVLRNVSDGFSGLVDGNGFFLPAGSGVNLSEPVLFDAIPRDTRQSLFMILGDILPPTCMVLAAIQLLIALRAARGPAGGKLGGRGLRLCALGE